MTIRPARPADLARLPGIEARAAARFAGVGLARAAELPLQTLAELEAATREGRLLVAADADDAPIGFAVLALLDDDDAHLQEVDVEPDHAGRGLGRALIAAAASWSARRGRRRLTLTTYRDVPFNAPFYERVGFAVLAETELTPALAALRERERQNGVEVAPRVAMAFSLAHLDQPSTLSR